MTHILITGALGFVGQYLTRELLEHDPDIRIKALAHSRKEPFLTRLTNNPRIEYVYGVDIRDREALLPLFVGVDVVFHCAAAISFSRRAGKLLFEVNEQGTQNVIDACLEHGVKRLVHMSSVAAVGYTDDPDLLADEDLDFDWSTAGKYLYMLSKRAGALRVKQAAQSGLDAVIANPTAIYGPGDPKTKPLLYKARRGQIPAIMPGGLAMVDVRDVVRALVLMMDKGRPGERYILTGGNYTHNHFFETLAEVVGVRAPGLKLPMWCKHILPTVVGLAERIYPGELILTEQMISSGFQYRYYSSSKAKRELGWEPQFDLEQTLQDAVEYIEQEKV